MSANFLSLILFGLVNLSIAGNIIFITSVATQSHVIFLSPFIEKLIQRGHGITFINNQHISDKTITDNITSIHINIHPEFFTNISDATLIKYPNDPFPALLSIERRNAIRTCQEFVSTKEIKQLIESKARFDVALTTSFVEECPFVISKLLAPHVIYINFMRHILSPYAYTMSVPSPYSFLPHLTLSPSTTSIMTFVQRFTNAIVSFYHAAMFRDYESTEEIMENEFKNAPRIRQVNGKLSMIFYNGDPVLSEAIPEMPYTVTIGGLHCRPSQSLGKQLESVIESSGENGFIYFSLGTLLELSSVSNSTVKAFVDAFARLKQTVIWKSREDIKGLSSNVKLIKWAPQQDLLGHSKIRLYICQGGIFGLQEAIYHQVPVLGFPVFLDQFSNLKRLQDLGCGLRMDLFNLTADLIYSKINTIINQPSFKECMVKYSMIFKDQEQSPLNRAVYWTEYFMRHNENVFENQNPINHLNWFSYFCIDIIFSFFFLCLILFKLIHGLVTRRSGIVLNRH